MKKAASVLGIIAGSLGVIVAIIVMAVGGPFAYFGGGFLIVFGLFGLILSGTALAGGILVHNNLLAAGIMMLVAGTLNFLFAGWLWIPSFIMCVIGGIFALVERSRETSGYSNGGGQARMSPGQQPYGQPYGRQIPPAGAAGSPSFCSACGVPLKENARFCATCGQNV
jgi:hypothetical protein